MINSLITIPYFILWIQNIVSTFQLLRVYMASMIIAILLNTFPHNDIFIKIQIVILFVYLL